MAESQARRRRRSLADRILEPRTAADLVRSQTALRKLMDEALTHPEDWMKSRNGGRWPAAPGMRKLALVLQLSFNDLRIGVSRDTAGVAWCARAQVSVITPSRRHVVGDGYLTTSTPFFSAATRGMSAEDREMELRKTAGALAKNRAVADLLALRDLLGSDPGMSPYGRLANDTDGDAAAEALAALLDGDVDAAHHAHLAITSRFAHQMPESAAVALIETARARADARATYPKPEEAKAA